MAHIFISYRTIEQEFALKLARDLLQAGYPVWVDRLGGIVPGDGVRRELEQGVNDAAAFLACLSGNYVESKWCLRELGRADGMGKPIIPVLIGSVLDKLWPIAVQSEHYADFRDWKNAAAYQAAFSSLLEGIEKQCGIKPGESAVAPIPVAPDPRRDDPEDIAERDEEDPQKKTYNGKLLSLNFQDIEVRAVLQIIADFTGLSVVVSDTVQGNLTLRLQNVPWDQALDIILRTKGLTQRQNGNVIYIAPTEEVAAWEKLELEKSLYNRELEPLRSELIQINYAKATALAALLQQASLLSQRGIVTVDERTNTILVQDIPSKLSEIRNLVTRLDVPVK